MKSVRIRGDRQLLIMGWTLLVLLAGIDVWFFVSVATGAVKAASPADRIGILWLLGAMFAALIGSGCLCMNTWRVDYFFTADSIRIVRGFQRKGQVYEARSYRTIECVMDSTLSFGTKDPNSYYLVMSRQPIPRLERMTIGDVRQEKDRVVIRMGRKNREALQQLADMYPGAPWVPGIRRALSKASSK